MNQGYFILAEIQNAKALFCEKLKFKGLPIGQPDLFPKKGDFGRSV